MTDTDRALRAIIRNIISDLKVGLGDEFDQNFERQGFFSEKWQRRRSPLRPGGLILVDTGGLRKSVRKGVHTRSDSISFSSDHPAAAIHNEGGEIVVTARMKRYFWFKYKEATGSFGRRKDGSLRRDKRNARLSTEAEFYKCMALMKAGSTIKMPKRQFIGASPEVDAICRKIIDENITKYLESIDLKQ